MNSVSRKRAGKELRQRDGKGDEEHFGIERVGRGDPGADRGL